MVKSRLTQRRVDALKPLEKEAPGYPRLCHPGLWCPCPAVRSQVLLPPPSGRRQEGLALDR